MAINIKLPNITSSTIEGKISQIITYLRSTSTDLNQAFLTVSPSNPTTVEGSITRFALSCKDGVTSMSTSSITTDMPSTFTDCIGQVTKASGSVAIQLTNLSTGAIATRICTEGMWSRWRFLMPE